MCSHYSSKRTWPKRLGLGRFAGQRGFAGCACNSRNKEMPPICPLSLVTTFFLAAALRMLSTVSLRTLLLVVRSLSSSPEPNLLVWLWGFTELQIPPCFGCCPSSDNAFRVFRRCEFTADSQHARIPRDQLAIAWRTMSRAFSSLARLFASSG